MAASGHWDSWYLRIGLHFSSYAGGIYVPLCSDRGIWISDDPLPRYQHSGFYPVCLCVFFMRQQFLSGGMNEQGEKKSEKEAEKRLSTRQFIGAKEITDYSLVTYGQGELVYFIVKPTNISVLSESSVGARIYALMTVLKGVAEIEMLCLNSRESFEDNKRFLKSQMEQEENPVIRHLLEQDQTHLDRIQVQMATAREFLIMLRLKDEKESDIFPYLSRIENP